MIFPCPILKFKSMRVIKISTNNPIIGHYLAQLRDVERQQNIALFRRIVYKLGTFLAYESSKELDYQSKPIKTPFSDTHIDCLMDNPIMYAIIRAGIKLQEGVNAVFEDSLCGFCSCKKDNQGIRHAELYTTCDTANRIVYICDPIAASGSSIIETIRAIDVNGKPSKIIILNIITTPLAIENIQKALDDNIVVYTCAIDHFTKGIRGTLPGLGDVGDLLYGKR